MGALPPPPRYPPPIRHPNTPLRAPSRINLPLPSAVALLRAPSWPSVDQKGVALRRCPSSRPFADQSAAAVCRCPSPCFSVSLRGSKRCCPSPLPFFAPPSRINLPFSLPSPTKQEHSCATRLDTAQMFLYTWDIVWEMSEFLGYPATVNLDSTSCPKAHPSTHKEAYHETVRTPEKNPRLYC